MWPPSQPQDADGRVARGTASKERNAVTDLPVAAGQLGWTCASSSM